MEFWRLSSFSSFSTFWYQWLDGDGLSSTTRLSGEIISGYLCIFFETFYTSCSPKSQPVQKPGTEPVISQLDQLLSIGNRAGIIYPRLFKYSQQHTAGFTEKNWAPHLTRPALPGMTSANKHYRTISCEQFIISRYPFSSQLQSVHIANEQFLEQTCLVILCNNPFLVWFECTI